MEAKTRAPKTSRCERLASAGLFAALLTLAVSGLWFGYGALAMEWLRAHV